MVNRRWWDLAALAAVAVVVTITAAEPPYGTRDWLAWGAAGAFLLFYVGYARARIGRERRGTLVIVTLAFSVIIAVGCAGDASFATLQAFMYPFLWVSAPGKRAAVIANITLAGSILVGYLLHFGPAGLTMGIAVAALSLGFSLALGLWITRIAEDGEERGRLLEELQAAQGELAAMHRDAGVTDERARLAREIHDTIAQSLTGLVMVAQRTGNRLAGVPGEAAEAARADIVLIEEMAREALTEARGLVAALAPVTVDTTLADALARLATSFTRETGVQVHVEAASAGLDRELEVVLLRTAQEGLANIRKHAGAATAWIRVERVHPDELRRRGDGAGGSGATAGAIVRLRVRDDGVGPRSGASEEHGFGLAGIRDRVTIVGGRVSFARAEGGGAELTVEVPAGVASRTRGADSTTPADGRSPAIGSAAVAGTTEPGEARGGEASALPDWDVASKETRT